MFREDSSILSGVRNRIERSFQRKLCEKDPLKAAISLLTDEEIRHMNRRDLFDMIRLGQSSSQESIVHRELNSLEKRDLERLAILIRRKLRLSIDSECQRNGYSSFFREPLNCGLRIDSKLRGF